MPMCPPEFLITSGLTAAWMFAKQIGWGRPDFRDRAFYGPQPVYTCSDPTDFEGVKYAIVHVGIFEKTPEAQALKRVLLNRATARHFHIIEYDLDGDTPKPITMCLLCGLDRPCMRDEDLQPGEPGSPCTFDPTIHQLVARLRAEEKLNAEYRRTTAVLTESLYKLTQKIKSQDARIADLERADRSASREIKGEGWDSPRISKFSRRLSGGS